MLNNDQKHHGRNYKVDHHDINFSFFRTNVSLTKEWKNHRISFIQLIYESTYYLINLVIFSFIFYLIVRWPNK